MLISVGIFVVLTAVLLVLSIGYIIQKKGFFEKKYHFNLVASSGADLVEGMPVLYSGFTIGVVTSLKLTDKGQVYVVIEIPKHERRWLKENSLFYLNKPLIGSPTIMVESKKLEASLLENHAERELITKDGINELIGKVQPVLDDLQGIVTNINLLTSEKGDLAKILRNSEIISYKLSKSNVVSKVESALVDKKRGILPEVALLVKNANSGILGENNSSLSRINAMLDDIALKLKKLDHTVDVINESSDDVSGLTKDVKFSIKKTDEVLEGLSAIIGSQPEGKVVLP